MSSKQWSEIMMNKKPWEMGSSDGMVVIDDLVALSWNNGIVLWDWTHFAAFVEMARWREIAAIVAVHNGIEPHRLIAAVDKALPYQGHELLGQGLTGSWAQGIRGPITFELFLDILAGEEINQQTRRAKARFSKLRRMEFSVLRAQLVLQMIEAGIPYRCAHPGCSIGVDLTIDHKLALSRGGGDEIDNLQFMCIGHNSAKSDK